MSREFEDSENAKNPKNLSCLGNVFHGVLGGETVENLGEVEGEDAKNVNYVQGRKDKLSLNMKDDSNLNDDF